MIPITNIVSFMSVLNSKVFFIPGALLIVMALTVISGNSPDNDADNYTDPRDGKVYEIVAIGELLWFKKNLEYHSPGSICYDSLEVNCDKYGRLYSLDEARSVCPEYWRLPNPDDVENLHKEMHKRKIYSIAPPGEWEVTKEKKFNNSLGLTVLPAGRIDSFTFYSNELNRWVDTVAFHQKGVAASYWLDDRQTDEGLTHWHIGTPIGEHKSGMHRHLIFPEIHKFSVRCVCNKVERK